MKEIAAGARFVLVGMSSGGWGAHALARYLESIGRPAAGVVLIDTYQAAELTTQMSTAFLDKWFTTVALPQIAVTGELGGRTRTRSSTCRATTSVS